MSVADKSIDPRIFTSAKNEFLNHGFEAASLKNICDNAGVTTGALYKRYKGKEDLFCAVVEDTVKDLNALLEEKCSVDYSTVTDKELYDLWTMTEDYMLWWFDFLYKRKEGFTLLLKCAQGTRYSNFQHDWVEKMHQATYGCYLEARKRSIADSEVSKMELHVLTTAFWSAIYEPFIHEFTWKEIIVHSNMICRFFDWHKALGFKEVKNV